jgi:hypothetical protein
MKYIFRGHTVFEYLPDSEYDKVIQYKVYGDQIAAFDYCNFITEDYNHLSNFFDIVYRHLQGENVELKDIEVY